MAAVLRGEIYWADLDPTQGSEQAGRRPVLVLSEDVFNARSGTVIAVALTSQEPWNSGIGGIGFCVVHRAGEKSAKVMDFGPVSPHATRPDQYKLTGRMTTDLFAWAEALELGGRHDEAAPVFADFERKALLEAASADNANHELVAYYTDYAKQPEKALRIAEQELARRRDAYTLDAHAWSLAAAGHYTEAETEIKQALAFGLKDPKVREHARVIAGRAANPAE